MHSKRNMNLIPAIDSQTRSVLQKSGNRSRGGARNLSGFGAFVVVFLSFFAIKVFGQPAPGVTLGQQPPGVVREISSPSERLELIVNESRIISLSPELTPANRIPQAQVNNRDIVELTPLSPTQIQIFAKRPGVTQVNIWDERGQIYTIDVIVLGDARELAMILQAEFPGASLTAKPIGSSVLISGYVEHPEDVAKIREIAEQFYPKVLTNIRVSGVQQVLLHVKAMEVSRTKLRSLGLDWSTFSPNTVVQSMGAGVLAGVTRGVSSLPGGGQTFDYTIGTTGTDTFRLSIIDGSDAFLAVLDALRRDSLMQVLAEPTLVTVSGRPAFFQVGGEVPTLAPAGLGTVSIEYKRYGTQVDFVPIVLGNGRIRLEVRPRVSDIDLARSITVNGQTIYAFNTREVDTGVELQAGQTLAIAGLVQTRVEAERRGIPVLSELPLIGIPFRKVTERTNEVELLILVTPELVEPLNPDEVPSEGPGTQTDRPTDWEFYVRGFIEVPRRHPTCAAPPGPPARPSLIVPPGESISSKDRVLSPEEFSPAPIGGPNPSYSDLNVPRTPNTGLPQSMGSPATPVGTFASPWMASPSTAATGPGQTVTVPLGPIGTSGTTRNFPPGVGPPSPGLIGPAGYEPPAR
jgi:pilus assembly protein CpaC